MTPDLHGTLRLTDDGLELPEHIHGCTTGFTVRVPTTTIQLSGGAAATMSECFPLVERHHWPESEAAADMPIKNQTAMPDRVGIKKHATTGADATEGTDLLWYRVEFEADES